MMNSVRAAPTDSKARCLCIRGDGPAGTPSFWRPGVTAQLCTRNRKLRIPRSQWIDRWGSGQEPPDFRVCWDCYKYLEVTFIEKNMPAGSSGGFASGVASATPHQPLDRTSVSTSGAAGAAAAAAVADAAVEFASALSAAAAVLQPEPDVATDRAGRGLHNAETGDRRVVRGAEKQALNDALIEQPLRSDSSEDDMDADFILVSDEDEAGPSSEVLLVEEVEAVRMDQDELSLEARRKGKRPAQTFVINEEEDDDVQIVSVASSHGKAAVAKRRRLTPFVTRKDMLLGTTHNTVRKIAATAANDRAPKQAVTPLEDGIECTREAHTATTPQNPVAIILNVFPDAVPSHVKGLFADAADRRIQGLAGYSSSAGDVEVVVQRMLADGYPKDEASALAWVRGGLPDPSEDDAGPAAVTSPVGPEPESSSTSQGLFECECCTVEYPYTEVVPCPAGHMFCETCVEGVVKSSCFGVADTAIKCMAMNQGCKEYFPISTLRHVLPPSLYENLIARQQDEALKSMENLFTCPKPDCGYAVVVDDPENFHVFNCQKCKAKTCALCHKDWDEHVGKKCNEVEDETNTSARQRVEEEMTKAMLRQCAKCSLAFEKEENTCNKMTCRCGAVTCYLCLKLITKTGSKAYEHFCQHPRNPGEKCRKCKKCELWTTPKVDEERVAEAKRQAVALVGHQLASGVAIGAVS
eukprot:m.456621 g.456621  ORF g.456621 m.456621 type:complete len:695 (+) comp21095_c0_seq1:95-2179(+)